MAAAGDCGDTVPAALRRSCARVSVNGRSPNPLEVTAGSISVGSATYWKESDGFIFWLTNLHVVTNAVVIRLDNPEWGHEKTTASMAAHAPERDLALLITRRTDLPPETGPLVAAPPRDTRKEPLMAGDCLAAVGYPYGLDTVSVRYGRFDANQISDVQPARLVASTVIPTNQGNSGGPLLHYHPVRGWEYVGMNALGIPSANEMTFAFFAHEVLEFAEVMYQAAIAVNFQECVAIYGPYPAREPAARSRFYRLPWHTAEVSAEVYNFMGPVPRLPRSLASFPLASTTGEVWVNPPVRNRDGQFDRRRQVRVASLICAELCLEDVVNPLLANESLQRFLEPRERTAPHVIVLHSDTGAIPMPGDVPVAGALVLNYATAEALKQNALSAVSGAQLRLEWEYKGVRHTWLAPCQQLRDINDSIMHMLIPLALPQ